MASTSISLRIRGQIRCFSHLTISQFALWVPLPKVTAVDVGVTD